MIKINKYTSDFSQNTNGWNVGHNCLIANLNSEVNGESNVLCITNSTKRTKEKFIRRGTKPGSDIGIEANKKYSISFKYYIPATNSVVKKIRLGVHTNVDTSFNKTVRFSFNFDTVGSWAEAFCEFTATSNDPDIRIYLASDDLEWFEGESDEKVYIKDFTNSVYDDIIEEGKIGRVNVPISEVPAGVNWDIIIDSNGNYYRRNGNTYVSLGSGLNEVTYDELVDLVTGSLLVPEAKYKITDFVEFDGQPERPIIVTAGSTSQLKPDFYFYDEPSIVGRYSIENDQDECPGAITGFVITDIDNVTDYSFTIPAISPSTRTVVQVPLTNVQNKNQLLCAFYINCTLAELNQFNIPEEGCIAKLASDRGNASVLIKGQVVGMSTSSKLTGANSLLVTRNYLKCRRFFSNNDNSIFYNGNKPLSLGYVYDQLIYPVIAGWYSTGSFGALKLDKKVQLESAWLTFENNSVVLNLAFYNFDTVANTPKTINVHVYE